MNQYKYINSQLNKLKTATKMFYKITLRLLSYMINTFNNGTDSPHKLLLTDRQISRLRKGFANN